MNRCTWSSVPSAQAPPRALLSPHAHLAGWLVDERQTRFLTPALWVYRAQAGLAEADSNSAFGSRSSISPNFSRSRLAHKQKQFKDSALSFKTVRCLGEDVKKCVPRRSGKKSTVVAHASATASCSQWQRLENWTFYRVKLCHSSLIGHGGVRRMSNRCLPNGEHPSKAKS